MSGDASLVWTIFCVAVLTDLATGLFTAGLGL